MIDEVKLQLFKFEINDDEKTASTPTNNDEQLNELKIEIDDIMLPIDNKLKFEVRFL